MLTAHHICTESHLVALHIFYIVRVAASLFVVAVDLIYKMAECLFMATECLRLSALLRLDELLAHLYFVKLINYLINVLEECIHVAIVLRSSTIRGSLRSLWSLILLLVC